ISSSAGWDEADCRDRIVRIDRTAWIVQRLTEAAPSPPLGLGGGFAYEPDGTMAAIAYPSPLWGGVRGFHVLTESATSAPSPLRGGLGRGWVWRSTEGPPPPTPPLKGEGSKKALIRLTVKGSRGGGSAPSIFSMNWSGSRTIPNPPGPAIRA